MSTIQLTQTGYPRGNAEIEWLKANGIPVDRVCAWQKAEVYGGMVVLNEFMVDAAGRRIPTREHSYAQHQVAHELKVGPEQYGLQLA